MVPVSVTPTFVPTTPFVGLMELSVGEAGASTVKVRFPVVPPGVVTETFCAPSVAVAAMLNVAVMLVLLATTMPWTVMPPVAGTLMVLPAMKFVPVSATFTLVPCTPVVELIAVSVGTEGLTVNVCAAVVPPAVVTVTFCAPSVAFPAITNVAVSVVVLVTLMFDAVIPVPLKLIVVFPETKFVPVSVTVGDVP